MKSQTDENNLKTIWKNVLGKLETEISKANFHTLFSETSLISLEDNIATVGAPSAIIIDLIQKRFLSIAKAALSKELGKEINIIFIPKSPTKPHVKLDAPLFNQDAPTTHSAIGHLPRVRPDFTFETMAVSSSNQLAYISATTVAKNIGQSYNPLFIYGPVGVGKTHLMQAIANDVYRRNPVSKIIYITSEEFTNEVVEAIRTNQTHQMKRRFRSAALLIIDDIQFLAGKEKVQEELFHTFNILIDHGSQIILSSDRPPSEIQKLEKRLSSRFSGGLTVDIEIPDFELKTAILLIKSKKYGVDLPIDIAKMIAEKVGDTRSLEGMLLRIITESTTRNSGITQDLVTKTLGNTNGEKAIHFHPDDLIRKICGQYAIKPTQLKGPKRNTSLVKARQITMYILKKELGLTFAEIGNMLGGRDHTTIIHGVEKVENLVKSNNKINEEIMWITKSFRV